MVKAFGKCYQQLKDAGVTPVLQYLDNEVSKELKVTIEDKNSNINGRFLTTNNIKSTE